MTRGHRSGGNFRRICLLLSAVLGLCSCSTMQRGAWAMEASGAEHKASFALPPHTQTSLRTLIANSVRANPGKSGFRIYERGEDSFFARLALIRSAEKAIDLQYYAVADDMTSNLLIEAVLMAAKRGVRVRFLIDGFTVSSVSETLAVFDGMDNIEVRVFNPLSFSNENILTRTTGFLANASRANKRMHNKALIADNQMAIIGGRNLGDEYFDIDSDTSFKDIDILTAGPITQEISASFDEYWNDVSSYPLEAVHINTHSEEELQKLRAELKANWDKKKQQAGLLPDEERPFDERMKDKRLGLVWAAAEFIADDPMKVRQDRDDTDSAPMEGLAAVSRSADTSVDVISAYFVPLDTGVAWFSKLRSKGVKVRVLTNSLASTDVVAVHSGYEEYREPLLKLGVELYELRPLNRDRKQRLLAKTSPPKAGLHAKAYMIDGRYTMIGSLNMDPRSVELNTETLLIIDSTVITGQLAKLFEQSLAPKTSYRVDLDEDGGLVWHYEEDGRMKAADSEPDAGTGRRIQNFLFSMMPIESHL